MATPLARQSIMIYTMMKESTLKICLLCRLQATHQQMYFRITTIMACRTFLKHLRSILDLPTTQHPTLHQMISEVETSVEAAQEVNSNKLFKRSRNVTGVIYAR